MARRFEERYRISGNDEVIAKFNAVLQDLDLRVHLNEEANGKLDAAANEVRDRALQHFAQEIDPRFADLETKLAAAQDLIDAAQGDLTTESAALLAAIQQEAAALIASLNDQVANGLTADQVQETPVRKWFTTTIKAGYDAAIEALQSSVVSINLALGNKQTASQILTAIAGAGGYAANRAIYFTSGTAAGTYVLTTYGRTIAGLADAAALLAQVVGAGAATLSGLSQVITGGFRQPGTLVALSGTVSLDPGAGNVRYGTNNGAWTLPPLTQDGAVDLWVTNGASPGAVTISAGFENSADFGDAFNTTVGARFLVQLRRVNSIDALNIKALV